jgi:homoserine/homoserine lactone efflux protein
MTWTIWAVYLIAITALCVTPGPAVLLIISQALARGARSANWSILGIESGNVFYYSVSATGLGAVLLTSYKLFFAIKYIGAAYLVWLGILTYLNKATPLSIPSASGMKGSWLQSYLNGLVLQMANPKALLFYVALLPQFVNPARPVIPQMVILGCTGIVVEFIVLSTYSHCATRLVRLAGAQRFANLSRRVAGSILLIAGVGMATIRRP